MIKEQLMENGVGEERGRRVRGRKDGRKEGKEREREEGREGRTEGINLLPGNCRQDTFYHSSHKVAVVV